MLLPLVVSRGDCQLEVDFAARRVTVGGRGVSLTPTEFDILALLSERAGTVVSLDDIIARIWGEWFGPRNHVSVHVHHLRRKLGSCGSLIVTRRSRGYLLDVRGSTRISDPGPRDGHVSAMFLELLEQEASEQEIVWLLGDRDGRIVWVSESVRSVLGWPVEEVVGRLPTDLVHIDDVAGGLLADGLRDGIVGPVTARALRPDGSEVEIQSVARVFQSAAGVPDGALSRWQVVTGEMPLEQAPYGRHIATLTFDADSTLLSVDPPIPFLGWHPEEVLGRYFSLAGLAPSESRQALDLLGSSPGAEIGAPLTAVCGDGSRAVVWGAIRLLTEGDGLVGYVGEIFELP